MLVVVFLTIAADTHIVVVSLSLQSGMNDAPFGDLEKNSGFF